MWGVFNAEKRLIKHFFSKEEAKKYAVKCNLTWQSCGFYVEKI